MTVSMDRYEFIDSLRRCLSVELSADRVNEHVEYYNQYIDMQLKKGRTEQEILEELGNPRLIAKSIVITEKEKNNYYNKEESTLNNERNRQSNETVHISFKSIITVLIVILLIVVVVAAIFMVFIIRFLLPIILIGVGISFIIKTIKRN